MIIIDGLRLWIQTKDNGSTFVQVICEGII